MPTKHVSLTTYLAGLALLWLSSIVHADSPEGRWSGTIDIPQNPIEITVGLVKGADKVWRGMIDIPVQGLAKFPLSAIEVNGASVVFAMAGIPGEPTFRGQYSTDGSTLAGELSQGGARFPFHLQYQGAQTAIELPPQVKPEFAAELVGRWEGTLEISGQSLRLALVLSDDRLAGLKATLDSPDQGQVGMPVTGLSVTNMTLRAELGYAGAVFEGALNRARNELSGSWQQGGQARPLVLRRQDSDDPFPSADPDSLGIPAEALKRLSDEVQALVDNEQIVGGELTVIKDRRTVLRQAFGWKDREAGQELEINALYCVRSMTKPLVGTAIQMLIDQELLALDTLVHQILPTFATDQVRKITIEHLLTHTSGLPFTTLTRPLTEYANLADVAAEAAATELLFEPGTDFQYSDAGSDTLGAVVAAVTKMPAEQYLQQQLLDPLGMVDTVTKLDNDIEIKQRIPIAYSGGTGAWSKHWDASDADIFPLFLSSQSLYSTTMDYAKFLALWLDSGAANGHQLLSPEAIERGLRPNRLIPNYPNTMDGIETYYGQQWIVRARSDDRGQLERVTFGHDGSDGTHAWVWPQQDLMVLFFTQSRGTLAGIGLERKLQTLLVDQQLDPSLASRDPGLIAEYTGLYWDESVPHAYYVVEPRGDGLTLARPGKVYLVFEPTEIPARYVHEANSEVYVEFLSAEDGTIAAMRTTFGDEIEHDPRHTAIPQLPSVSQVVELVRGAHGISQLDAIELLRLSGSIEFLDRNMQGLIEVLIGAGRSRTELNINGNRQVLMVAGPQAWSETITGISELEGRVREQARLDQIAVMLDDWRRHYEHVEVLKNIVWGEQQLILLRVVPKHGFSATLFVDAESGLIVRKDSLVQIPGVGIVGLETTFEDFRDLGGMKVAFKVTARYQNPLIGRVITQFTQAETEVEAAAGTFSPLSTDGD